MNNKVAHYLQEHLVGEVVAGTDARHHFETDGSILHVTPSLLVYPRSENDVRKTARFSWQLAERGRIIPITARGMGTDGTGAAIGSGIVLSFPAHMNRILELDTKAHSVIVEPGTNFGKLQQALHTHGRYLPSFPPSLDYSTIGGAIANNVSGMKSVKYGPMKAYVKSLRVVLANGEVIETQRLSKRDFSKKLGLSTFEGEIYRSIDTLIEERFDLIEKLERGTTLNNAGYDMLSVKQKDGSFDLTPLFTGSQGTLGIITEAVLETVDYDPKTSLILAQFDSLEYLQQAILELRGMENMPSALELVDQFALTQIQELNPNHLKDILKPPFPSFMLFIEFDGGEKPSKKALKKARKILDKFTVRYDVTTEPDEQIQCWKIRDAINVLLAHNDGLLKSLPLFDGAVPPDRVREFLEGIYRLMSAHHLKPAVWGQVGDGNLNVMPRMNIGQVGDKQKIFRMMEEFDRLVLGLSGTISATSAEGRLHAPYLEMMYGPEAYSLLQKVKTIFDPYGTLNPGVKMGTTIDTIKSMMRSEYDLSHIHDYLPRN
ncbi:MAG TPA: FAD-binding oxidoreductase [Candidatus Saccharimonadales bacterium]|nr:FAD-binding oxidoreductase [Candidatus Saccharimonadales bacterium]